MLDISPIHEAALVSALEEVIDVGCVVIREPKLLRIYGRQKITVGIWRDIWERWENMNDEEGGTPPLLVGKSVGAYTFVWGVGLMASKGAWFQDIRTLARSSEPDIADAA